MARKHDVHVTRKGREEVKKLLNPHLAASAERIASASNAQSSWGGYTSYPSDGRAVVVGLTHDAQLDNARAQRILRNVSAGKVGG